MTSLETLQNRTCEQFIQSVIIIDDNITSGESASSRDNQSLIEPDDIDPITSGNTTQQPTQANTNEIDSQETIKSFAKHGIACVPYKWNNNYSDLPPVAFNVDIPIIDWELGISETKEPLTAEPLIKELLEFNQQMLRVVIIYTDSPDVAHERIKDLSIRGSKIEEISSTEDYLHLTCSEKKSSHVSTHIITLEKMDHDMLAEKTTSIFKSITTGFLPNAVLAAATATRKATFKLLSMYNSSLDLAALTHYTTLKSSPDNFDQAELYFRDYIAGLISADLHDALLYDSNFQKIFHKNPLSKSLSVQQNIWIATKKKATLKEVEPKKLPKLSDHQSLLDTLGETTADSYKAGNKFIFVENNDAKFLEFSHLSSCHKRELFSQHRHPLKFGTIVERDNKYYLCIQPLCDGVRLEIGVNVKFPMVQLYRKGLKSASPTAACSIKIASKLEFLYIPEKPHQQIVNLEFQCLEKPRDVRTYRNNFVTSKNKKYKWLAELREDFTRSIVHKIANLSSRIGTDQYEWMRVTSK